MISRDPSEALQGLVHVFEGLGRYTDPAGLPWKSGSRGFKVVERTNTSLLIKLKTYPVGGRSTNIIDIYMYI